MGALPVKIPLLGVETIVKLKESPVSVSEPIRVMSLDVFSFSAIDCVLATGAVFDDFSDDLLLPQPLLINKNTIKLNVIQER